MQADGGWDPTSFCDPKTNIRGEPIINHWAQHDDIRQLDQVRRDEIREKGPQHKALIHKTRFIWLKNPWNLTERQAHRLGELERLNLKINRAYLLKNSSATSGSIAAAAGRSDT